MLGVGIRDCPFIASFLPVTLAQLVRPGIGNTSCLVCSGQLSTVPEFILGLLPRTGFCILG